MDGTDLIILKGFTMATCMKAKRGHSKHTKESSLSSFMEKIRLDSSTEHLLKTQSFKKIGVEDLRTALHCVRAVQAGYQRKINECKENGDICHLSYYEAQRDRLVRWMQDYTSLAETNSKREYPS